MPIIKTNPNTLRAASPKTNWLKCSEAIPPLNKKVLCASQSGMLYVGSCRACRTSPDGYCWHLNAVGVTEPVTYWREL
jgi:hypothetical protein